MPDAKTIVDYLETANLLYQQGISAAALALMADEWAESFGEVPEGAFAVAMRMHRERSAFWPKVAHIAACLHELREAEALRRRNEMAALPPPEPWKDPDAAARAQRHLAKINAMLRAKHIGGREDRA